MDLACTNILIIVCKLTILKIDDAIIINNFHKINDKYLIKDIENSVLNMFTCINKTTYRILILRLENFSLNPYRNEVINRTLMKAIGFSENMHIGRGSILISFTLKITLGNKIFKDLLIKRKYFVKIVHPLRYFLMLDIYKKMRKIVSELSLNSTMLCNYTEVELKSIIQKNITSKFSTLVPRNIKSNYTLDIKIWRSYYTDCYRVKIIVKNIYFIDIVNGSFKYGKKVKIFFKPFTKTIRE